MNVLPPFELSSPRTLEEALHHVANGGLPYCGGTELIPSMALGLLRPDHLVSLRRVERLKEIRVGTQISIGSAVTHRTVERDPLLGQRLPVLARVAGSVGNARVRASGTIGGNIAFAEPRSDVSPLLTAVEATVTLAGPDGERSLPVSDFLIGPYSTALADGELLTEVRISTDAFDWATYERVCFVERPAVSVALARQTDPSRWRLVVGAVSDSLVTFEADDLDGLDPGRLSDSIEVVGDHSASADYKQHLTMICAQRAIATARDSNHGDRR